MKSVRVATLEVSEGEGMRGSSHFTGRPRAGFFTLFTVAIGASYPGLGTERRALSAVRARQSPTLPGSVCEPIEDHPNEKRKRSQCSCLVVARPTLHQRTRPWNMPAPPRHVYAASWRCFLTTYHGKCRHVAGVRWEGSLVPRPLRGL